MTACQSHTESRFCYNLGFSSPSASCLHPHHPPSLATLSGVTTQASLTPLLLPSKSCLQECWLFLPFNASLFLHATVLGVCPRTHWQVPEWTTCPVCTHTSGEREGEWKGRGKFINMPASLFLSLSSDIDLRHHYYRGELLFPESSGLRGCARALCHHLQNWNRPWEVRIPIFQIKWWCWLSQVHRASKSSQIRPSPSLWICKPQAWPPSSCHETRSPRGELPDLANKINTLECILNIAWIMSQSTLILRWCMLQDSGPKHSDVCNLHSNTLRKSISERDEVNMAGC